MLGQPSTMLIPEVIGVQIVRPSSPEGATATDLVLTVTEMLRKRGVVEKFVEFFGDGLGQLPLADRATIANMAPEYGATCGIFPIDEVTLEYLRLTGREEAQIALVREYALKQGLWRHDGAPDALYTDVLHLDLGSVQAVASRDRSARRTASLGDTRLKALSRRVRPGPRQVEVVRGFGARSGRRRRLRAQGRRGRHRRDHVLHEHLESGGACSPRACVARNARGLRPHRPALGQDVARAGLEGRHRVPPAVRSCWPISRRSASTCVGYGCTTCIGNSGPLNAPISKAVSDNKLSVASVPLRQPQLRGPRAPGSAHELTSPRRRSSSLTPLAGHRWTSTSRDPLGRDAAGKPVYLRDIWPTALEVQQFIAKSVNAAMFSKTYADVFHGDERWRGIQVAASKPTSGTAAAPTSRIRPTSTAWARSRRPSDRTRACAASPSSATRSPPTTSRPPARSGRMRRPASTCSRTASCPRGLQQLRRAPRQSRSDDARHLRQYRASRT